MNSLFRLAFVLLLSVSLLLPMVSTALAALGLSGSQQIVICTGSGLQVITLDADGNPAQPAEVVEEEIPCALIHAVDRGSEVTLQRVDLPVLSVDFPKQVDCPTSSFSRQSANAPRAPPLL